MRSLLVLVVATLLACCSSQRSGSHAKTTSTAKPDGVAYFAGGCFWGVEHFMQKLDGVEDVVSGYAGGTTDAPSYEEVINKDTGHLESVRVRFHSKQVSYKTIAKRFFEIHDPTQTDGQGPDIGAQYRSAVFYTSPEQKADTESLIQLLTSRGYKVATELREFAKFWPAEEYHQDYYVKTGKQPYCHGRVKRFGDDS
jgi:peptide methionine sulfoxide reductase msrA/msrB